MNQIDYTNQIPERSQPHAYDDAQDFVGFDEIFTSIFRRKFIILACIIILGTAATLYNLILQKDSYTATASVVLLNPSDQLMPNGLGSNITLGGEAVQSEVEIIKSETIAKLVVEKLKLYEIPYWNGEENPDSFSGLEKVSETTGIDLASKENAAKGEAVSEVGDLVTDDPLVVDILKFDTAVTNLISAIDAHPLERSYVLAISVRAAQPDEAAELANAVANAYLEWHRTSVTQNAQAASVWLDDRLEELSQQLAAKEAELSERRSQTGMLSSVGATLTEQRIRIAQNAYTEAKSEYDELASKLRQVTSLRQNPVALLSSEFVLDAAVMNSLRTQRLGLSRKLVDLSTTYGDKHPEVVAVSAEIEALDKELNLEISRNLTALQNRVDIAGERMMRRQQKLEDIQLELEENSAELVKLESLEREAQSVREQYKVYANQYQQTTDRTSLGSAKARLVSSAGIPKNSNKPSLVLFSALGIMLGGLLGLGIAFFAELLDDKIYGATDVWRKLKRRTIVSIPKLNNATFKGLKKEDRFPATYVARKPLSGYAEAMRVIINSVALGKQVGKSDVISVTSALPNEGKTTIALSLARTAAMSDYKVLVIDCDFRRHTLGGIAGIDAPKGFQHVLLNGADWRNVVVQDHESGAFILPSVEVNLETPLVIDSTIMTALLDEMRGVYDLIILDGPPILALADATVISEIADSSLVVVRAESTNIKAVQNAIRQIETAKGRPISGVVLNYLKSNLIGRASHDDSIYFKQAEKNYYTN